MFSFNDMIPDKSAINDLPQVVRTLAVAVAHLIMVVYGINALIMGESKLFDVQEKHLWQVLKGVKYQSRSKQKWQLQKLDQDSDILTNESSSSSLDDGAKVPKWKHHQKSKSK